MGDLSRLSKRRVRRGWGVRREVVSKEGVLGEARKESKSSGYHEVRIAKLHKRGTNPRIPRRARGITTSNNCEEIKTRHRRISGQVPSESCLRGPVARRRCRRTLMGGKGRKDPLNSPDAGPERGRKLDFWQ